MVGLGYGSGWGDGLKGIMVVEEYEGVMDGVGVWG